MNAPVTRRSIVANTAATLGAAVFPVGMVDALVAEEPHAGLTTPATFDAVAFLADLEAAGCRVCLALPATMFRAEDRWPTYLISWPPRAGAFQGYCAVMSKWSGAMASCPDHVDLVTARLAERGGAAS